MILKYILYSNYNYPNTQITFNNPNTITNYHTISQLPFQQNYATNCCYTIEYIYS